MAAASDEQEVLKARLLAKEASLRDLTKRYLQFVNGVEGKSAEECGVLYQGLLKEIARYEFAVSKARSLIETNTRQVADYDQMRQVSEPPHARALPRTPARPRRSSLPAPCGIVLSAPNPGLTRAQVPKPPFPGDRGRHVHCMCTLHVRHMPSQVIEGDMGSTQTDIESLAGQVLLLHGALHRSPHGVLHHAPHLASHLAPHLAPHLASHLASHVCIACVHRIVQHIVQHTHNA